MTGKYLFKYMSVEDTSIDENGTFKDKKLRALNQGKIWFSHLDNLNDPYENQYDYDVEPFNDLKNYLKTIADIPQHISTKIDELKWQRRSDSFIISYLEKNYKIKPLKEELQNLKEVIKKHKSSIAGVLSLCSENDNLLMWAHYANSHKGFCLSFSKEGLHNGHNYLVDSNFTQKVTYSEKHLTMHDIFPFYTSTHPNDKVDREAMQASIQKIFFHKSLDWEIEHEWRVIQDISKLKNKSDDSGALCPFPGQLNCVYFGARCSQETINAVKQAVKNGNYGYATIFKKASLKNKAYGLVFYDI